MLNSDIAKLDPMGNMENKSNAADGDPMQGGTHLVKDAKNEDTSFEAPEFPKRGPSRRTAQTGTAPTSNNTAGVLPTTPFSVLPQSTLSNRNGEERSSAVYTRSSNAPCAALNSNDENLMTFQQFQQFLQWQKSTNAATGCSNNLHLYGSETEAEDDCKDGPSLKAGTSASGDTPRLKSGEDEEDDVRDDNDTPLDTATLINFDEAQEHNAKISEEMLKFFAENVHSYDKSLPQEWTPTVKTGIREGKVVNLPGGRKVTIQEKLGKGVFGTVYLVHLEGQPEHCALKIQRTNDPGITNSLSFEFLTQWEIGYKLRYHQLAYAPFPRSIELHNFEGGSLFFMSAELGVTLHSIYPLWGSKCVPVEIVVYLADEMLTVLERLHCKGKYAHCDLKSDNAMIAVLLDGTCIIKLIDFGRAKSLTQLTSPLTGVAVVEDMMCKNMRLCKPWGVDQDYHGMATCLPLLLLNKEMTKNNTPIRKEDDGTRTMELMVNPSFPRSTRNMWKKIFNKLLNFDARKYDETVREVREVLGAYERKQGEH